MNEGAEEPDWVKHDRELESETEEALADLDAVVSGERDDRKAVSEGAREPCAHCDGWPPEAVCPECGAGERPDAIPDEAYNAAWDALKERYGRLGILSRAVVYNQPSMREIAEIALDAALPFLRAAHPEAGSEEGEREPCRVVASMPVDAYEVLKPLIHKLGGEVQSAVHAVHPEADRAPTTSDAVRGDLHGTPDEWPERQPTDPDRGQLRDAATPASGRGRQSEADRAPEDVCLACGGTGARQGDYGAEADGWCESCGERDRAPEDER